MPTKTHNQMIAEGLLRTPTAGDHVGGWDTSAGEDAWFPVGTGPGHLLTGSGLSEGLVDGLLRKVFRAYDLSGADNIIRLIPTSAGNVGLSARILGINVSNPRATADVGVNVGVDNVDTYGSFEGRTLNHKIRLVTFSHAGQSWIGIEVPTSNLGAAGLNEFALVGAATPAFDPALVTSAASGAVGALQVLPTTVYQSSGRPADPIGHNQPLYISGNPGTAKEVMVDGNGFIVEV